MRASFLISSVILSLGLVGCGSASHVAESDEAADTVASCDADQTTAGHPRVYFAPFDRPEAQAICLMKAAKKEVFVAHYNIRRQPVIDTLIALKQRGVDVRIAVDKANAANEWNTGDDQLEAAGIKFVRVKPNTTADAIMHLKSTVIDNETVMTGSFNYNEDAALANDENMIVIRDPAVVTRYRNHVLSVIGDQTDPVSPVQVTPTIAVHYSPTENENVAIVAAIDGAKSTLDIAMFTFTESTVVAAAIRAIGRGVRVRVVMESKQLVMTHADDDLEKAGATVVRGANQVGQFSAMHQKYGVIDGTRVLTGASNWTRAGTSQNDEDLLVIDLPEVATQYEKNFADLVWMYGGKDVTAAGPGILSRSASPMLFNPHTSDTKPGDRVVVVGSAPELGNWDPSHGVNAITDMDLFPSWTAPTKLSAGSHVEYKFVIVRSNGDAVWEQGGNRVLDVPATGRGDVIVGNVGDTSKSWSPRTAP